MTGQEAKYRVYTDVIDIKVCGRVPMKRGDSELPLKFLMAEQEKTTEPKAGPNSRIAGWIIVANNG